MKHLLSLLSLLVVTITLQAQVAGDTIVVQGYDYSQNTYGQGNRTMMVNFPPQNSVTYEKILMLYNMRCKNGAVGNQVPPSGANGCGEWDYSCNTYITDSTKTDSIKANHPSHIIPGFSGSAFNYTSSPTYTYYQYTQQIVTNTATISETSATVGTGSSTSNYPFHTQQLVNKSQYLWSAAELSGAGLVAGNITSIRVQVTNAGGAAEFLKIKMKHSPQTALNASSPDLSGFTEVYFANTSFSNGSNQLDFYTPFNWNGTDPILIELSYSNSSTSTSSVVLSDITGNISGLTSGDNDFHYGMNSVNNIALNNTNWGSISNQLSIGFWSNGDPGFLPNNTSILHGHNANGTRQINVHLPWSNSRIYWDCGSTSGYDRIDLLDSMSEFEGKWNYWTFTKNSTTGIMNIYLNGNLWHTGSGKTLPIQLTQLLLGSGFNNSVPYFGKMDEFSVWNTVLSQTDIQNWMRKDIDNTHPQYANLLGYYKFNEGSGTNVNDHTTTAVSTPNSPVWRMYKGKDIFKGFSETQNRPTVTFVQGVYTQTITQTTVVDSIINVPYTVYSFSSNGFSITPVDTVQHYVAGYTYVYNGDNGLLIDSVMNTTAGTITITQMAYYQYTPSRFQIMSFVTPYGNGLNLGPTGKTWTFDLSDFNPILRGSKLMTMDAGGQWQEDMDIKFLFIVGTPPQPVLDIKNIWRVDAVGYTNILNDQYFEPRNVSLASNASHFKVRTAITGHGQEGEFIPQTHFININSAAPEFSWDVWKTCGSNPVYPQGGTWIYDRTGWCPGMATDTKEMKLDGLVTPGSTVNFDYGLNTAQGSSTYWVSNQLVTYGTPSFTLDAAIVDVKNPSLKVEYARSNSICADPKIVIQNTGTTPLTSAIIEYWVNNFPTHQAYAWNGNLGYMETAEVVLNSNDNLWQGLDATTNTFYAEIKSPNGGTDAYSFNNKFASPFKMTPILPADFFIFFKSNKRASENYYQVIDENGNIIFSRSNMTNLTQYSDTVHLLMGCYTFMINDAGGDGISFWADTAAGSGSCRLRRMAGQNLITFNPDFGNSVIYNFTVDYPLSYADIHKDDEINVYPNPTHSQLNIELPEYFDSKPCRLALCNSVGQEVLLINPTAKGKLVVDVSRLSKGIYFLKTGTLVKKVIVE